LIRESSIKKAIVQHDGHVDTTTGDLSFHLQESRRLRNSFIFISSSVPYIKVARWELFQGLEGVVQGVQAFAKTFSGDKEVARASLILFRLFKVFRLLPKTSSQVKEAAE
jgi:hypothetical protein